MGNERADRIMESATRLFAREGFEAVSMAQIARAADVNKALVFYYYESKERLFGRVLERYYGAHELAMRYAWAADGPLISRLHRVIDAYLDFIVDNLHYARLVQREIARTGAQLDVIRRHLGPLARWTTDALAEVSPADGPLAARHFFVTFSAAVINYFTYAPAFSDLWDGDPLAEEAIAERRAHLHWLVDAIITRLRDDD